MAFVFLILVFFIEQRGVSDKHWLLPFFSLVLLQYLSVAVVESTGNHVQTTTKTMFQRHVTYAY